MLFGKPLWVWLIFIGGIVLLLAFDLGVLNRESRKISTRKSFYLSGFYIVLGVGFSGWIYYLSGISGVQEYLTGYLLEKTLSIDNIFIMSLIFSRFQIPEVYQYRVLLWGIIGVIILRGIMIGFGTFLIHRFEWIALIFASFLVITGLRMLYKINVRPQPHQDSAILAFIKRWCRVTQDLHGSKFFVWNPAPGQSGLWVTPLFLVLILIEFTDLIFAIDSVPAILSITRDPYIIYTSNIFAVLGLRALYFTLAAILHRFFYLKYAFSLILIFIGLKVLVNWWLVEETIPAWVSLIMVSGLLSGGIILSWMKTRYAENNPKYLPSISPSPKK